jgi:hypothetical protein
VDVLEVGLASLVGRVDAAGAAAEPGFASTVAWLRARLGMRHGRAVERVRLARQLPRLEKVGDRLRTGGLSAGQAVVIAEAVSRLDDEDAALGEDVLLGLVDAGHSAGELARDAARITDVINQQRGNTAEPEDSRRGFARSWVSVTRSSDRGSWVRGWLSAEHGAVFDQVVGPLAKPATGHDDRDHAQRTADALFSVLSEGNKGAGVTVIIDLAAYKQVTGDTLHPAMDLDDNIGPVLGNGNGNGNGSFDGRTGNIAGTLTGRLRPVRPAARLLNGTPISPKRARQIALAAGVNALILGRCGAPLYLGRTVRFATPAQRKALLAIYDTCAVTGCHIPAHLCEIHHLHGGWKLGTPTDMTRLAPTCTFHNRWIDTHPHQTHHHTNPHGRTTLTLHPPTATTRHPPTTGPTGTHLSPKPAPAHAA